MEKAMSTYSVNAARSSFSKLIARVEQGEEIVITRGDTPVARLVPIEQPGRSAGGSPRDGRRVDPGLAGAKLGALTDRLKLGGLKDRLRLSASVRDTPGLMGMPAGLRNLPAATLAAAVGIAAAAVILAALAFEHIGGYVPCPLCLQQRYAYYLGIPAIVAALALLRLGRVRPAAALLAVIGLAFIVNTGLGVYQAGAEWKFWDPPSTCAAAGAAPSFNIDSMDFNKVPAICGVASWRFLGLSFAGWNAVTSALLAGGALLAALKALPTSDWPRPRRPGSLGPQG
jgi:prevent-host-death family protein